MNEEELILFCSKYFNMPKNKITGDLRLDSDSIPDLDSIKLYRFFAEVQSEFKIKLSNISRVLTIRDILKNTKHH